MMNKFIDKFVATTMGILCLFFFILSVVIPFISIGGIIYFAINCNTDGVIATILIGAFTEFLAVCGFKLLE